MDLPWTRLPSPSQCARLACPRSHGAPHPTHSCATPPASLMPALALPTRMACLRSPCRRLPRRPRPHPPDVHGDPSRPPVPSFHRLTRRAHAKPALVLPTVSLHNHTDVHAPVCPRARHPALPIPRPRPRAHRRTNFTRTSPWPFPHPALARNRDVATTMTLRPQPFQMASIGDLLRLVNLALYQLSLQPMHTVPSFLSPDPLPDLSPPFKS